MTPGPGPTAYHGPQLRVLTYNVNFGLAGDEETIRAIRDAGAELVLLQETNAAWERALRGAVAGEYIEMVFRNRAGAGGLAVLSRLPLIEIEFIAPTEDGWFPAGRAVVQTSFGAVQALNVHLRPPVSDGGSFISGYFSTPSVRAQEIETFVSKLKNGLPTVIAGDFNEEADGGVTRYLARRGMVSVLPRYATGKPTWRWRTSVGTIEKQLDHVVHDTRLETVSVEVRMAGRSDHLPVVVVLRPSRTAARTGSAPGSPRNA